VFLASFLRKMGGRIWTWLGVLDIIYGKMKEDDVVKGMQMIKINQS